MNGTDYIEINFRHANQQADNLDNLASRLDQLAKNDFDETMQSISGAWTGECADAYLQKGRKLEENMIRTAADLKKTAQSIRNAAKRIYDAEMSARELAENRTYGGGN